MSFFSNIKNINTEMGENNNMTDVCQTGNIKLDENIQARNIKSIKIIFNYVRFLNYCILWKNVCISSLS